ncbi:MAG TPA: substrate binding domain-containing protein, partial [Polyangiaceae bacterium]|nr:substrate binding domain-containing protein [Polyangiaceae bacterium]
VALAADEQEGHLRVTAPPEFGVRFVVPVLEELECQHPRLSVELSLGTGFLDLASSDIDVAIRIGTLPDSALRVRRLGLVPRVLVASPAYLKNHGTPKLAADLSTHRFLGYLNPGASPTLRTKTSEGQSREVRVPRPEFTVNSIATLVRMVEAGRGVFLGPLWAFAESLRSGRVRSLLADHDFEAYPAQALYRSRRYVPAKTRVFIEAMAQRVAAEESLDAVG